MTYDRYGNIASKNGVVYTYGDGNWKDLLTGYGEQTITYDAQGNPLSYLGHTLTWEKGRQLKSFDNNTYTYNANGIRTSKTVDGIRHDYVLDGSKILRETWDNNTLIPLYDNEDSICGILFNDVPYYFQKNLQGDVIGITDKDAHVVARYFYDAWGVCTDVQDNSDCSVATVNPFRYRSYYFDSEIGIYYLQSRYYNPVVGRFVNADEAMFAVIPNNLLQHNLFTYCYNNSVIFSDKTGHVALVDDAIVLGLLQQLIGFAIAILIVILVVQIFSNPTVQDNLSRGLNDLGNKIRARWKWLGSKLGQIFRAVSTTIIISKGVTQAINEALSKAKKKPKNNRYERHHIVAKAASNYYASRSRDILRGVGIGINSSYNLVDIKYNLHKVLHTNAYYKSVYEFLNRVRGSYRKVVLALNAIKTALQTASKACP